MRHGSQVPRFEHFPPYFTTAADDAVDLAAVAGLNLDPWQEYVLRGALGERQDGRWSAFRVCLTIPRQNGKNAILEARELAGLLLFGEQVIVHTAHEFKTAYNSMVALMNRIKASELIEYVRGGEGIAADTDIRDIDGFKTGNQPQIAMKNGNVLQFAARSSGSGRGFTGDLVVLDEAYALKSDEMAALLPTLSAKSQHGNPQVWFTSSAGMPDSDLLASLREEGMSGDAGRLAYFEWSVPDDVDPLDREAWYAANPGMGYRISEEYVFEEFKSFEKVPDGIEKFKRERLGVWARLGGETVFRAGLWAGLADEDSKPGDRFVFSVEIAGNRESATVCLVSERSDGLTHVEVVDEREGTSWIGSRLRELQEKHKPEAIWAIAGGHADALSAEWRREGVRVRWLKWADYVKACGTVFTLISDGGLRHLDDPILNEAVESVQQKFNAGKTAFHWARKSAGAEISSLVGLTVGVGALAKPVRKSADRKGAVIL